MAVCTQLILSSGMSARIAEAAALSLSSFYKRYRSSYETSSSSLTLLGRKRYRGTSELILDIDSKGDELGEEDTEEDESLDADDERERESRGLDDEGYGLGDEDHGLGNESQGLEGEGLSLEEEEVAPEGQQAASRRALESIKEIAPSTYEVDPEDDRVYTDVPTYAPPVVPVQTLPSPEWSLGSLPVSTSYPVVPSPIASLVATPTTTISVDEDQFIEVGAQDVRELYTRSGVVRDKIFSQRPMLALEAWTGHCYTRLADMSRDRYDDHILIHDMLVQQDVMQRELQEMGGHVVALEQEKGRKEP
ncbi:hypothetical protein Tco_0987448 [Tanacetum coccineum]